MFDNVAAVYFKGYGIEDAIRQAKRGLPKLGLSMDSVKSIELVTRVS